MLGDVPHAMLEGSLCLGAGPGMLGSMFMADVIQADFGSNSVTAGLERVFGDAAGLQVGLRRIAAPYGDELQVTVSAEALAVPRAVAVVLANSAGEDEADRIGKAVLEALQFAQNLIRTCT